MKQTALFIISVLAASVIQAQTVPGQTTLGRNVAQYRAAESFTEIVGLDVWNLQNERLDKVKFMTADVENGRLVEVVVSSGGSFLGLGARLTAVPPRALIMHKAGQVLRLNVSKARFDAAPRFNASHMAAATQETRVAEVNRYFGEVPWFFLDGQTVVKNAEILRMGHVQKLSSILGLQVHDTQGGYIGRVDTLMTDLPKGQIVHVVVATDAMSGTRSRMIQSRALKYNAGHSGFVLDNTKAEQAGEPRFKWLGGSLDSFQQESYVNREVQTNQSRNSKQNVQKGNASHVHAMEEGESFRDEQKTRLILQAIQADPNLSANAKNVEVVTLHAQTTLRGHVNTVEGKRRIGEIAMKAGRPENVSNQLQVRPR
jgi:sporulation protein YlmC with PRC-barrel domain